VGSPPARRPTPIFFRLAKKQAVQQLNCTIIPLAAGKYFQLLFRHGDTYHFSFIFLGSVAGKHRLQSSKTICEE
jgi:hypothetical protein